MRELLPWRDLAIETSWPPSVAAIELQKRIEPPRWLGGGESPFEGQPIAEREFRFRRRWSNKLPLMIYALVEEGPRGGACVRVQMRLAGLSGVFFLVWTTMAALLGFAALIRGQLVGLFSPILIVGVGSAINVPFAIEAREAERTLREIFVAAPALPPAPKTGEPYR
jgi:hypothetical protein